MRAIVIQSKQSALFIRISLVELLIKTPYLKAKTAYWLNDYSIEFVTKIFKKEKRTVTSAFNTIVILLFFERLILLKIPLHNVPAPLVVPMSMVVGSTGSGCWCIESTQELKI